MTPQDGETPAGPRGNTGTPDGYDICPRCGHHTSAFCGTCTVFVLESSGLPGYCGCDCYQALHGESLTDRIARRLHGGG